MPDLRAFIFVHAQSFAQRKIQVETFQKLLDLGINFFFLQE